MKDLSDLKISEYQDLIAELVIERGFDKETVPEVFTLLVEEVGELAKAIRKQNGQKIDPKKKQYDIGEETADILWLLLDISNRLDINLGKAFHEKELKNSTRRWE
ncbi:MAG: MazG nucleotide pyrophosphohydrolase domain-containing protein [Candidatus Saccharibacteria bacterium]